MLFIFKMNQNCFLHSIGHGSWVTDDITVNDSVTVGNVTSVQCLSTHLTSFAVLVDVAGGLQVCIGCHDTIIMLLFESCDVSGDVSVESFFGRIYQKWNVRPYRLFHTLDVPSLQSALLFLYCSSHCKGMLTKIPLCTTYSFVCSCFTLYTRALAAIL